MSQRLVELCTIFVDNAFGELASHIFSTLARGGRSSLSTLAQVTRLPVGRLKSGLAILIQHHIVRHYSPEEDYVILPPFYQVDLDATYNLARGHKYTRLVSEREGEAAGTLLANIIEIGHVSVGDLENAQNFTSASKRDSGIQNGDEHVTPGGMVNGVGEQKAKSNTITNVSQFHSTLRYLLDQGYIVKVTERSYIPNADYDEEVKQVVISEKFKDGKITGSKKAKEFSNEVKTLKRKWEDEEAYSKLRDVASQGTIKRSNDSAPSSKRVKLNGDIPNGVHDEIDDHREHGGADQCVSKLPTDMFVRANFDKCTLMMRNARLQQMSHYHLGPVTSAVYSALLRSLEGSERFKLKKDLYKVQKLNKDTDEGEEEEEDDDQEEDEDDPPPSATDAEVLDQLGKSIDLARTVKIPRPVLPQPKNGKPRKRVISDDPDEAELGIKIEKDSDDEEDEAQRALKDYRKRLDLVKTHLDILAEHPKRFVKRIPNAQTSQVNVEAITKRLAEDEIDAMVGHRFSNVETRLVRILREKGRLDEKSLQWMSMLRTMPLRQHLTYLKFAKICDCQEVPKDNSHLPNRMVHLWQFDEKRVASRYLHQTYQGMSRLLQRMQAERDGRFKGVIGKAERVDVKGREQELLTKAEKELLKEWRDIEEQTFVQVDRLDDLVGVLRDFHGDDHQLMT